MADSFFGFNTSLSGFELDDGSEVDEEEYDALNNETFGSDAFQGDWESDHTRFAAVSESHREYHNSFNSERDDEDLDLETTLSQLVLDDSDDVEETTRTDKVASTSDGHGRQGAQNSEAAYWNHGSGSPAGKRSGHRQQQQQQQQQLQQQQQQQQQPGNRRGGQMTLFPMGSTQQQLLPPQIPHIPTVQELEQDLLLKNSAKQAALNKENMMAGPGRGAQLVDQGRRGQLAPHPAGMGRGKFPQMGPAGPRFPPGFPPPGGPQRALFPQMQQEMVMARNKHNLMMVPPPHLMPSHPLLGPHKGRLLPLHFIQTHPLLLQQHHLQQQHQHQQHQANQYNKQNHMGGDMDGLRNGQSGSVNLSNMGILVGRNLQQEILQRPFGSGYVNHPWLHNPNRRPGEEADEYAGLMNNRERRWLLNIQMLQLQTEKPHLDDYYYTVWNKKQERLKKERERNGLSGQTENREPFFANNRQNQNQNQGRERRDSDREGQQVTPKVYEPLQFENSLGRLQCGSVTAPRKIIDMDIVSEPVGQSAQTTSHKDSKKTKKILLELERLYLIVMELEELDNKDLPVPSEPQAVPASKPELLSRITASFLSADRFLNFMCIRKGKALLLRVLPHLYSTQYRPELTELWVRIVKNLPAINRRDNADYYLLKMYPHLKTWLSEANYSEVSLLASQLVPTNNNNNTQHKNSSRNSSRAVSPNPGKTVLAQALTSKFGISLLSALVLRGELLYPNLSEQSRSDWCNFVSGFIKNTIGLLTAVDNISSPIDPIPSQVLSTMLSRSSDDMESAQVLANLSKSRS